MNKIRLNFVGIGAARSGTTWLAECLSEHPQVCISDYKELNFFCKKHLWPKFAPSNNESFDWYHERFSHCKSSQIRGEISPSYLVDQDSPVLIKKYLPNIKILVSFRNPTESLYSLYHQFAKKFSVPKTFEEFINKYPNFIEYGYYHTHTKRFLESFPWENFHFIIFDDIKNDPAKVMVDTYKFLEIRDDFLPLSLNKKINYSQIPRSLFFRNLVGNTREMLSANQQTLSLRSILRKYNLDKITDKLIQLNLKDKPNLPINDDTKTKLMAIYASENESLGHILGRDLSSWNVL
jgi:hypothetical protein